VQLVNLLSIVTGEALKLKSVIRIEDEDSDEQDPEEPPEDPENTNEDPEFRAPARGDFAYEDYMTKRHQEDFLREDTDDDEPSSKAQKKVKEMRPRHMVHDQSRIARQLVLETQIRGQRSTKSMVNC
jgi:hypothetical protein